MNYWDRIHNTLILTAEPISDLRVFAIHWRFTRLFVTGTENQLNLLLPLQISLASNERIRNHFFIKMQWQSEHSDLRQTWRIQYSFRLSGGFLGTSVFSCVFEILCMPLQRYIDHIKHKKFDEFSKTETFFKLLRHTDI